MALSNKQKKLVETKETVEVQQVVEAQETVSKDKETVFIYVGPTTRSIAQYTVYRGGYPPQLKKDLDEFPLLKNLFVDPTDLPEFLKNMKVPGSAEQVWFNEAQKYFAKRAVNEK